MEEELKKLDGQRKKKKREANQRNNSLPDINGSKIIDSDNETTKSFINVEKVNQITF
jgi:hypothetical protein